MKFSALVIASAFTFTLAAAEAANLAVPSTAPSGAWRELSSPHQLWPTSGAIYYAFKTKNGSHAHLIVVNMRNGQWQIRPAVANPTTSATSQIANREGASAALNGGYFNLKETGDSTSYVVINGVTVADPTTNKLLIENPKLKSFLPKIFDRTEARFMHDSQGKLAVQIERHSAPLPAGYKLLHSLQAGPRLLPSVDAKEEAFLRTEPDGSTTDAIGVKREAARTAFGVTNDGYAMLITVEGKGQDPESSGITLDELAATLKNLGCVQALNFDGGASSTMYVRLGLPGMAKEHSPAGSVVAGKNPETRVKSVLLLVPQAKPKRVGFSGTRAPR